MDESIFDDAALAAISTDVRQYNVFTFLEDDGNDDDSPAVLTEAKDGPEFSADEATNNPSTGFASTLPVTKSVSTTNVATDGRPVPPKDEDVANLEFRVDSCHLDMPASTAKRKIIPNMTLDLDNTMSPASSIPDLYEFDGQRTPDDVDDPVLEDDDDDDDHRIDMLSNSVFGPELDWEDSADNTPVDPIPEYTAREEYEDSRKWRMVQIGDKSYRIDMEVIEPYKKVLSHGGYYGDGVNAIVVFVAYYLPEKSTPNYHYIMDNLFLYVMSTVELLVVQEYMIVYFHSATSRHKIPGLRWFRRCYDMIDRRLRKSLRGLLVVHPSLILKTILLMMKAFVSSKFSAKVQYVNSLTDLTRLLPTEYMFIPDEVIQFDAKLLGLRTPSASV